MFSAGDNINNTQLTNVRVFTANGFPQEAIDRAASHVSYESDEVESYELGAKLSVEAYSQYEFNEFLLLDRRILGGVGLRYTAYASKRVGLWLGSSAMLEGERLNAEAIAATEDVDTSCL